MRTERVNQYQAGRRNEFLANPILNFESVSGYSTYVLRVRGKNLVFRNPGKLQ